MNLSIQESLLVFQQQLESFNTKDSTGTTLDFPALCKLQQEINTVAQTILISDKQQSTSSPLDNDLTHITTALAKLQVGVDILIKKNNLPSFPQYGVKPFQPKSIEMLSKAERSLASLTQLTDLSSLVKTDFSLIEALTLTELNSKLPQSDYCCSISEVQKHLNRYSLDIFTWNHNYYGQNPGESYVNASHIKLGKQHYIATQGPLDHTIFDFLEMIRKNKSNTIVSLVMHKEQRGTAPPSVKCAEWWETVKSPITLAQGYTFRFDKTEHLMEDESTGDDEKKQRIVKRQFLLEKEGSEPQTITQFHYENWPDMGTPKVHLFDFLLDQVHQHKPSEPIIVHCSAGVGRTATFIGADHAFKKIKEVTKENLDPCYSINFPKIVLEMRAQRPLMLQNEGQYMAMVSSALRRIKQPFSEIH